MKKSKSKLQLIGFEGKPPKVITSATAALSDGTYLVNAGSRHRVPIEEAETLAANGQLTLLPKARPLDPDEFESSLVVLLISTGHNQPDVNLKPMGNQIPLVLRGASSDFEFFVFRNRVDFDQYRKTAIDLVLLERLLGTRASESLPYKRNLIHVGLSLFPAHPVLNALRVTFAPADRRDTFKKIATANIRDSDDALVFETVLEGTVELDTSAPTELDHILKYEEGAAKLGGFPSDVAGKTLTAISDLHPSLMDYLKDQHAWIKTQIPPPHVQQMLDRSAEIHLRVTLPDDSLATRLSRYLEMRLLERVLKGEVELPFKNKKSATALDVVTQPAPDTKLRQRPPLGSWSYVSPSIHIEEAAETSRAITVLAFHQGVVNDVGNIELKLFPGWKILPPAKNDGRGNPPVGLAFLESTNNYLFRPVVCSLIQRIEGHKIRYFIKTFSPLEVDKTGRIDAFPSSFVPDVFVTGVDLLIKRVSERQIECGDWQLPTNVPNTKDAGTQWLRLFSDNCRVLEIKSAVSNSARWTDLPTVPRTEVPTKLLFALYQLGGEASISDLMVKYDDLFKRHILRNNTHKNLKKAGDTVVFNEDKRFVSLTDAGLAMVRAYDRFGAFDVTDHEDA